MTTKPGFIKLISCLLIFNAKTSLHTHIGTRSQPGKTQKGWQWKHTALLSYYRKQQDPKPWGKDKKGYPISNGCFVLRKLLNQHNKLHLPIWGVCQWLSQYAVVLKSLSSRHSFIAHNYEIQFEVPTVAKIDMRIQVFWGVMPSLG